MNFLFVINSLALGVGLAMDAFSVSLVNGLQEPNMTKKRACAIAGVYAFFQYAMPLLGWICVHTIVEIFSSFKVLVPWIALFLLSYIGGKMVVEALRKNGSADGEGGVLMLSVKVLLMQGIATSIDALSTGFTIAEYKFALANAASLIIAAVTFTICIIGLAIGRKVGSCLSKKASLFGGILLIAIGIEIFARGNL